MSKFTVGKKLSWYLRIIDLEELKRHSYQWYKKNLDYSNLFTFTGEGEFYFSRDLENLPLMDWNYLISIIGANCVGFILNLHEESHYKHIAIWRMEGGSITECKKILTENENSESVLQSIFQQISSMDRKVMFQHNWDIKMEEVLLKEVLEDTDIFSVSDTRSFSARLHLELINPPDENPGDFNRYRLR